MFNDFGIPPFYETYIYIYMYIHMYVCVCFCAVEIEDSSVSDVKTGRSPGRIICPLRSYLGVEANFRWHTQTVETFKGTGKWDKVR